MSLRWIPLPMHTARVDERLEVRWSDYYGAALVGDEGEIVRLPHQGCRLEVIATAESAHREVNLVLPGQVIHYKGACCLMDRFELPSGTTVGVWHLVGFTLRLTGMIASDTRSSVPPRGASEGTMDSRFAGFWARVLVCVGMLFVVLGFILAASALVLNMPWGKLTGQAVVEQTLAMVGLMAAGVMAGAPLIVMGEMLRVFLDQRQLLGEISLELRKERGEGEG